MRQRSFGAVLAGLVAISMTAAGAQTTGAPARKATSLGSARIASNVMADGKPLAAGTYMLRVSDEMPTPVVGQSADEARWIEFVQGGTVKGREMATVLSKESLKAMSKKAASPASGAVKVELLKGADYIRVWVNHGGSQYLIHLTLSK